MLGAWRWSLVDELGAASASGWAGLALAMLCPLMRSKRAIIACYLLSASMYLAHFLLLGRAVGAATQLIGILSAGLSLSAASATVRRGRGCLWLLLLLAMRACQEAWDYLPVSGAGLLIVGFGQDVVGLRLFSAASQAPWLAYALHVESPQTAITCVTFACMHLVAAARTRRDGQGTPRPCWSRLGRTPKGAAPKVVPHPKERISDAETPPLVPRGSFELKLGPRGGGGAHARPLDQASPSDVAAILC